MVIAQAAFITYTRLWSKSFLQDNQSQVYEEDDQYLHAQFVLRKYVRVVALRYSGAELYTELTPSRLQLPLAGSVFRWEFVA